MTDRPDKPPEMVPLSSKRPLMLADVTMRDHFAGLALPSVILACSNDDRLPGETQEQLFARRCYAIADAMLAARGRSNG